MSEGERSPARPLPDARRRAVENSERTGESRRIPKIVQGTLTLAAHLHSRIPAANVDGGADRTGLGLGDLCGGGCARPMPRPPSGGRGIASQTERR